MSHISLKERAVSVNSFRYVNQSSIKNVSIVLKLRYAQDVMGTQPESNWLFITSSSAQVRTLGSIHVGSIQVFVNNKDLNEKSNHNSFRSYWFRTCLDLLAWERKIVGNPTHPWKTATQVGEAKKGVKQPLKTIFLSNIFS